MMMRFLYQYVENKQLSRPVKEIKQAKIVIKTLKICTPSNFNNYLIYFISQFYLKIKKNFNL